MWCSICTTLSNCQNILIFPPYLGSVHCRPGCQEWSFTEAYCTEWEGTHLDHGGRGRGLCHIQVGGGGEVCWLWGEGPHIQWCVGGGGGTSYIGMGGRGTSSSFLFSWQPSESWPLLVGSQNLTVTRSVTSVAAKNWLTMESTPEHLVNPRRSSTPRPSWDWWLKERSTPKVMCCV